MLRTVPNIPLNPFLTFNSPHKLCLQFLWEVCPKSVHPAFITRSQNVRRHLRVMSVKRNSSRTSRMPHLPRGTLRFAHSVYVFTEMVRTQRLFIYRDFFLFVVFFHCLKKFYQTFIVWMTRIWNMMSRTWFLLLPYFIPANYSPYRVQIALQLWP